MTSLGVCYHRKKHLTMILRQPSHLCLCCPLAQQRSRRTTKGRARAGPPLLPATQDVCSSEWELFVKQLRVQRPSSQLQLSGTVSSACPGWTSTGLSREEGLLRLRQAWRTEREGWTRAPVLWSCWGCWSTLERGCALWPPLSYHSGWPCPPPCCLWRATIWACGRPAWSRTSGAWSVGLTTACWASPVTSSWPASSCVHASLWACWESC